MNRKSLACEDGPFIGMSGGNERIIHNHICSVYGEATKVLRKGGGSEWVKMNDVEKVRKRLR